MRLIFQFIFSTHAIGASKNRWEIYFFSTPIIMSDFLFPVERMKSKRLRMILSSIAQLRLFFIPKVFIYLSAMKWHFRTLSQKRSISFGFLMSSMQIFYLFDYLIISIADSKFIKLLFSLQSNLWWFHSIIFMLQKFIFLLLWTWIQNSKIGLQSFYSKTFIFIKVTKVLEF